MKILLATDGSDSSEKAAGFLNRLSLTQEDEVKVLHVVSDIPFMDDSESYALSLSKIQREIAPKILDTTVKQLSDLAASITTAVTDGNPAGNIVEMAGDSSSDLIVIGSRGLKGLSSFLLGSTARSVAISSPLPLLVVKPPAERKGPLSILYATDGSDEAVQAGSLLAALPLPADSTLTIMTVITSYNKDIPERYWMEVNERIHEDMAVMREKEFALADRIAEQARDMLSAKFPDTEIVIRIGDPSIEIVNTARDQGADIVVVGSRGLRGIKGMLGSVSRDVTIHAECSVLIAKGKGPKG